MLIILDGWGLSPKRESNAIALARPGFYESLLKPRLRNHLTQYPAESVRREQNRKTLFFIIPGHTGKSGELRDGLTGKSGEDRKRQCLGYFPGPVRPKIEKKNRVPIPDQSQRFLIGTNDNGWNHKFIGDPGRIALTNGLHGG